jgi:ferritin
MISQTLTDAINEQIKHEFYSSNLYLSMAAWFESVDWPGFATWMRVQNEEEATHAKKFVQYLVDRGSHAVIGAIDAPPSDFAGPHDAFQQVLTHEQKVTGLINKLYALAVSENDYAAQSFLLWFINEQVEEEKNASQIVGFLKRIGENSGSLFALDHQLSKRGK